MASHRGARTKRARNDGGQASYDANYFPSRAHADHFYNFDRLPVDPGRRFDREVLDFFQLPSLPGIQTNKLFNLMRFPVSVNEHAIKLFYCNLTDKRDEHGRLGLKMDPGDEVRDRLWSYVYGQEIEITPDDICSLIEVPTGGADHMTDYHGAIFYSRVFDVTHVEGDAWRHEHALRAKRMPQAHRVLHLYLAYNYVPRVGRHSSTTYSDLWIMYRLLNGDLINFWDIMVTNFKKVTNGPNRALLRHSRLITALLMRKGIQFVFPSRSVSSEPFTMAHLTKGDWRRTNDGSFVRREPLSPIAGITLPFDGDGDDGEDDDDDADDAPAADLEAGDASTPPAPAPLPASPMAAPMDFGGPPGSYSGASSSFDLAQEFHNFRLDVNQRLDDFSSTQNQMQADLHDFFQHFYSIHPRPPPPPPPSDD